MGKESTNRLTDKQIKDILDQSYNNPESLEVCEVKPLSGGVLNELYHVTFKQDGHEKQSIIKAYQGKSLDPMATASTQEIFELHNFCKEHNGAVPDVVACLLNTHQRNIIVMDYVEGELLNNPTTNQIKDLGKVLAHFHFILKDTPKFAKQPSDINALASEFKQSYTRWRGGNGLWQELNYLYTLSAYAVGTLAYPSENNLTKGLLHGDIHAGNVIKTPDDKLVLLDFDLCRHGSLIKDIANAICMFCIKTNTKGKTSFDFDALDAFLSGYDSVIKLRPADLNYLTTSLKERAQLEKIANMKLRLQDMPAGSPFNKAYEQALNEALKSERWSQLYIQHLHLDLSDSQPGFYVASQVSTPEPKPAPKPILNQFGVPEPQSSPTRNPERPRDQKVKLI